MDKKCPGADSRFLKIEICKCPKCGYEIELFSDETRVKCPKCKNDVYHDKTPSCIDWCKYARECIGEKRWEELKGYMDEAQEKIDFKEKILMEMRIYFGIDIRRIRHAEKVTGYAEQILEKENGNRNVVIPAAILHDIGIKECERKYNSTDGQLQEKESPLIAKKILEKLGVQKETITEICQIISCHHSPGGIDSLDFKILWDADQLVNLKDGCDLNDKYKLERTINKIFFTKIGKELAYKIYIKNDKLKNKRP